MLATLLQLLLLLRQEADDGADTTLVLLADGFNIALIAAAFLKVGILVGAWTQLVLPCRVQAWGICTLRIVLDLLKAVIKLRHQLLGVKRTIQICVDHLAVIIILHIETIPLAFACGLHNIGRHTLVQLVKLFTNLFMKRVAINS